MSEICLKTEKFDITRTVAMKFGRTVIDDSLIVPDVKPDIKKILDVSARSFITDVTPGQDKVHVEGTVKATVLYLPDGDVIGRVKSLEMSREFSMTIDSKGVTADNRVTAESETDAPDSTLINSRKVNVRVCVNVGVKICKSELLEFPVGLDTQSIQEPAPPLADLLPFSARKTDERSKSENAVQLKKIPLRFADKQFCSDGSMILRGQHEISAKLPQIGEVLYVSATVEPDSASATDGNVKLAGNVKICVLYEDFVDGSENGKSGIRTAEFSIPYDEQFDVPGAMEDMECDVEYTVRETYTDIMDNMDGEQRTIGIEAVIGVNICGCQISEPGAVTDGYCTDGRTLNLEFTETVPEQLIDTKTVQLSHKCMAKRKPTDAEISGVCGLSIQKTSVDDVKIKDGTVYIKGSIAVKILCSSNNENQPLYPIETTTEFEHNFDIDRELGEKVACDAKIFVNHPGYTISGADAVDVRMLIGIYVKLVKNDRVKTVCSIEIAEPENTIENGMQSYIIYFVQPGDTLWNIAKRYKTTIDEIVANNGITDPDKLNVGQKIRLIAG